jgi:NAD+ kinase
MTSVYLATRTDRDDAIDVATTVRSALTGHGIDIADAPATSDVIVAIGGDGTVLSAAADAVEYDIPLCGVNVGRVGYLAEYEVAEIDDLAGALAAGTLERRSHSLIEVTTGTTSSVAVNDVVVEKVISQRIIEVAVTVDSRPLASYRTDGIIVATPLGSTAYSLSAGGPVVDPSLDALVVTPIAPHSLLTRPVVLGPRAVVRMEVAVDRPARVNVDGRELCIIEPNETVTVRTADRDITFLSLGRHPFPQAVREQFGLDHA